MRIDAYTHFFPAKYFENLLASKVQDIGKRVREVPAIHDLEIRRKVIDSFPDYRQIICVALPPIGTYTAPDKAEGVARLANDGLKELCDKYPDQFAGFVAEVPLTAPDAGARESERAIKELGACGVQIVTNVGGKPLDRPEFEPFFAKMNQLKLPVWVHPTRTAATPDYADEKKSLYEIWWTFGWSYETAAFMARMVFSKIARQVSGPEDPGAHFRRHRADARGPHRPGLGPARRAHLGRGLSALLKSLKKRPLDYFKQNFYADSAVFGGEGATIAGKMFYPLEKIVFAAIARSIPRKARCTSAKRCADREDGLDQGRARAGVLQEPGADHREEAFVK
jgi:aminocarboxymuconate-semialdehyde decarboxylase